MESDQSITQLNMEPLKICEGCGKSVLMEGETS